jgi:hypothetical protein
MSSWTGNQLEVNIFIYGYESVWLPLSADGLRAIAPFAGA